MNLEPQIDKPATIKIRPSIYWPRDVSQAEEIFDG